MMTRIIKLLMINPFPIQVTLDLKVIQAMLAQLVYLYVKCRFFTS